MQKDVFNCPPVTAIEIRQFLGIIFMSVYYYSNAGSYWGKYGFDDIRQTMTVNRFEKITSVIHFNDNAQHKQVGHPNHMIVFIK
ncbi:DDE_Tnp_1_7 domain-containing protein [Trichonephila clavata]|uniref:DDE_Tnp_1_7 domain-containing protein n=1 Tax=Trichonephila clavata TaxID=2740835 RepID=A0A8X6LXJ0_TRICU|nr:DDE_Tnp_1_7 domain-containing protein [Trichonephila clavata]